MQAAVHGFVELRRRHALLQQADAFGFARVEDFGAEEQATRLARADRGDDVGRDHRRDQAELHFAEGEFRAVHADGDVATGDQADAAAVGRTVHAGEGRFAEEVQGAHQLREAQRILAVGGFAGGGHAAHPVQVGARGKGAAVAAQHDRAHRRVLVQGLERRGQIGDQAVVEGVVHGRPVQADPGDATASIDQDGIGHARFLR